MWIRKYILQVPLWQLQAPLPERFPCRKNWDSDSGQWHVNSNGNETKIKPDKAPGWPKGDYK